MIGCYLSGMREAVIRKTEGLTEEQLRAPGVPSGTNLLGLVQHLAGVERHWLQRVFRDEELEIDRSMTVPADVTRAQLDGATGQ